MRCIAGAPSRYNKAVSTQPDDRYFVNALVDGFFLGFASLIAFLWFRYAVPGYSPLQVNEHAITLSIVLGWFGSWPHFSATAWRLYESRELRRRHPLTAWLAPLLALFTVAACFVWPVSIAPYVLKLFALWSPWHFSLQTFGLTLIYARRAGFAVPAAAKRCLLVFFIASFLVQYSEAEASLSTAYMLSIAYPQFRLPHVTPLICQGVMWAALAASVFFLYPSARAARRFPWIVALAVATQYLWFVHGARDLSFQLLLPLFHGLQYLLVAWALELGQRTAGGASTVRKALVSGRWFTLNLLIGATLFYAIPRALGAAGFDHTFSTLMLLAGVSLHHYFVDGVLWKLRREGDSSLLFRNAFAAAPGRPA